MRASKEMSFPGPYKSEDVIKEFGVPHEIRGIYRPAALDDVFGGFFCCQGRYKDKANS